MRTCYNRFIQNLIYVCVLYERDYMRISNVASSKPATLKTALLASAIAFAPLASVQKAKAQTATPINTFMYDGSVKNSSKVDFGTVALFAGILTGTAGLIKNVVKNLPKQ